MNNTGKFVATVSVNGRAMDSKGNIIQRDPNGLPTMWFNVIAGGIPNRQTVTGSVVQRMGIPLDENGVIEPGADRGHPFARRIIYASWLHQSDHEDYGPQYSWNMIKDLTTSSVEEIEKACDYVGEPYVFTVERPELPEDYQRRTNQHIGRNRMDVRVHGTANQTESNPVKVARENFGNMRTSDADGNPEIVVHGNKAQAVPQLGNEVGARQPKAGDSNPDNDDEIIS
jgi:hypothetical protein